MVARPSGTPSDQDTARLDQLARRLMSVAVWTGRHLDTHFAHLGLTPAGARALLHLDPEHAVPTRYLAERLCCDPSNVTAFVDQLEESGLVSRQSDPADRRVRTLVMTAEGRRVRGEMARTIATRPPSLVGLTTDEQTTLLGLLDKAWAACQQHDRAARRPMTRGDTPGR
jgi:DNA-binding MarR family transcriptional regulator